MPKSSSPGGGIALIYYSDQNITKNKACKFPAVECTDYKLQMDGKSTIIRVFYHLDCINFLTFTDNYTPHLEVNILEKYTLSYEAVFIFMFIFYMV